MPGITINEIRNALKKMTRFKAPVEDGTVIGAVKIGKDRLFWR